MSHRAKFDVDLQFGQEGERWLTWLGTDQAKVEVKTERDTWAKTGNAVFEYECRGKPSGIAITEADYWLHILRLGNHVHAAHLWPIEDLKTFLRMAMKGHGNSRLAVAGDDYASKVILVPIQSLWMIGHTQALLNQAQSDAQSDVQSVSPDPY
jgi:hypothetical protein